MEFLLPLQQLLDQAVLPNPPRPLPSKETKVIPFLVVIHLEYLLPPQRLLNQAALLDPPRLLLAKETLGFLSYP
jgi:hypothetical protein